MQDFNFTAVLQHLAYRQLDRVRDLSEVLATERTCQGFFACGLKGMVVDEAFSLVDGKVFAFITGRGLRPHGPDDIHSILKVFQAHLSGREGVTIGNVLILLPACPDTQDNPASG